jgi:transposase
MLVELRVAEQQLRAVWEVLDGASVTEVARRFQVSRQSVHVWLRRYAADQGWVIGRRGRMSREVSTTYRNDCQAGTGTAS